MPELSSPVGGGIVGKSVGPPDAPEVDFCAAERRQRAAPPPTYEFSSKGRRTFSLDFYDRPKLLDNLSEKFSLQETSLEKSLVKGKI